MGRKVKRGLDAWAMDVDLVQDIRVRRLINEHGAAALSVYVVLLCMIYSRCYYIEWNADTAFVVGEQTGLGEDYVQAVILTAARVGLLSEEMLRRGVLTSQDIQRRYEREMQRRHRRLRVQEYSLISYEEMPISYEEIKEKSEEMPAGGRPVAEKEKSKEKENFPPHPLSKEKENKKEKDQNVGVLNAPARETAEEHTPPRVFEFFGLKIPQGRELTALLQQPQFAALGATESDATRMSAYWEARGWQMKDGAYIRSWAAAFYTWMTRKERVEGKKAVAQGYAAQRPRREEPAQPAARVATPEEIAAAMANAPWRRTEAQTATEAVDNLRARLAAV